jgi:hypothetical protein
MVLKLWSWSHEAAANPHISQMNTINPTATFIATPDMRKQSRFAPQVKDRVAKLERHCPLRFRDLIAPVDPLDHLFSGQRDQHADYDDAYFANQGAPAVEGFGEMDVHVQPATGLAASAKDRSGRC